MMTPDAEGVGEWSLPSVAYAAFFTAEEREEIGTFDELPAHERVRWQSVAAHIARTVVAPIDEDLTAWRAEQQVTLARQVQRTSTSRELSRAMTRTTDLQERIAKLRSLLEQPWGTTVMARPRSRRPDENAETDLDPI